jgi:phosphopantothenoylcysteine decarboxylase/phosphopantothenate--cysteine ligase
MHNYLNNKRILIGITGGIAAYKILELIRRLKDTGADVRVILSAAAHDFVTPLSIQALTGETQTQTAMDHIELARWAEVLLIAPATANFIAKYAHGLADDLLSTVCLATTAPVLVAPAMNQQMWLHSATQNNIALLQLREIPILGPGNGSQACGEFGPGRMLEPNELLDLLDQHFAPQVLSGKHILITAGPTQEQIDPVRYLSNHSSGKMGYALAHAALKFGATVTLISGPCNQTPPISKQLKFVSVISSKEMYEAVMHSIDTRQPTVNIFIGCAAVADYRPVKIQTQKIKKDSNNLILQLERTEDILTAVASLPTTKRPFTIGFAAETENLLANASKKLEEKCLDLIIANAVDNGKAFNQEQNQVVVLSKTGQTLELPLMDKSKLAFRLLADLAAT